MPAIRITPLRGWKGVGAIIASLVVLLSLAGCTRDDVAAALSRVAVEFQATLVPLGETASDRAPAAGTQIPDAITDAPAAATDESSSLNPDVSPTPQITITAKPTETLQPTFTNSPPTATIQPTETTTATPPPTSTAMPVPAHVEVPSGSMTLIQGGSFQMGADAEALFEECNAFREGCQPAWFAASEPVHTVQLDRFYIDAHEVTNAAFTRFLNEIGADSLCLGQPCIDAEQSHLSLQNGVFTVPGYLELRPVAGITWYGASAYCQWRGARLPTEAEWEKAAAWDNALARVRRYPWGDDFDGRLVNFCDAACTAPQTNVYYFDGYAETSPVTYFENGRGPNGLYDMAGNVWEWVADWFDPDYYTQSPGSNPAGPAEGSAKVVRGGSWYDTGNFTASAVRFPSSPDNTDKTIGFRCAADAP
jgi:formylglycine-generating enzyme required for sulfatase activity